MDKIYFTINGERYSLSGSQVTPMTSLNTYLRNYLQLYGTKAMCHEGGCGACIVSVRQTHPVTKEKHEFAVNSCLVNMLSCHGWDITTIEGVGNRKDGYHAIQSRLASFNGTQCGYCTPGMVMNMYSLVKSSTNILTTQKVENSFGSNMCRCTGYRPILDAFKSFANDSEPNLKSKIHDLEDLDGIKCIRKCERKCSNSDDEWCLVEKSEEKTLMSLNLEGGRWYKVFNLKDVFTILSREGTSDYRFVAGNTGKGVYPTNSEPRVLIDISSIESLKYSVSDENLIIGAGMSLTEVIQLFSRWANKNEDFKYLTEFANHLDLVAHIAVRNTGTIAGNLALKNIHQDFPSDIFILLVTVGATVTIVDSNLNKTEVKMQDFLKTDLKNRIILDIQVPPLASNNLIRTYKIMPRAQNAHAIVNAGFHFKLNPQQRVICANLVYGNINPSFIRAYETERIIKGTELFTKTTLRTALKKLNEEIVPLDVPPEPSPYCRKMIALGLFYKVILSLAPTVNKRYKSGGTILQRELSRGTQSFETDKSLWPLNKPISKLEGLTQCSGEVRYACDLYTESRAVHVAFILSTIGRGEILSFDPGEALKLPGVVAFLTANDIPGENSFAPIEVMKAGPEEILASKFVSYYGQPIGLIVAVDHDLATTAARLVKVNYKKFDGKLILNVRDVLTAPDKIQRMQKETTIKPTKKGTDIKHVLKGSYTMPMQYHYTMETQCCSVRNTSQGLLVRSATQWMDLAQVAIAKMLNLDTNRVEIIVPRLGGGYGGKASRSALVACACALVAYKLNRTATLVMPLTDNMTAIGKRHGCEFDYEVGTDDDGVIQYLNITFYVDCGISYNDSPGEDIPGAMTNLYESSTWYIEGYSVLTDKHSNTWCRAPGTTEAIAVIEHVMERIAHATNKDPIDVRVANIAPKHVDFKNLIDKFTNDIKYEERRKEIKKYNDENAWKKRGLKISLISFPIIYMGSIPVTVSIYHADATVAISHGGIEMGQGINTKVAQVCAHTLKVPLEKVIVIGSDSFISPNAMASNGSITSDCVAYGTVKACEELLKRLAEAVKGVSTGESTWEDKVKKAFNKGINLQASYMTSQRDGLVDYDVYAVCATEIELDVLTGTHIVSRVDLLEDTGVSMSPEIDIGQIEGAFVMGLGLWTTERLVYDENGRLLTNRTWTYKIPGAKDIPVDFRISFRRNSPNPAGVLRSKATGEPSLTLAVVVTFALHEAILEGRKEFGYKDTEWLHIDTPYSVENIIKAISANIDYFKLK